MFENIIAVGCVVLWLAAVTGLNTHNDEQKNAEATHQVFVNNHQIAKARQVEARHKDSDHIIYSKEYWNYVLKFGMENEVQETIDYAKEHDAELPNKKNLEEEQRKERERKRKAREEQRKAQAQKQAAAVKHVPQAVVPQQVRTTAK